jgi:predicted amidohydrolase
MFATGFTMNAAQFAENETGETLAWMQAIAAQKQAAVVGSFIFNEDGKFYNRLFWVSPNGNWQSYDKRHLFSLAGEEKIYEPGQERLVVTYKGWKILPLVCYDLRFPVWSRNTNNYDLAIYVANWPDVRIAHWDALLPARAIENQCFVVGVNRVGSDGNNKWHSGHSAAFSPLGEKLLSFDDGEEAVKTVVVSAPFLKETREKLGFLKDQDQFILQYE